MWIRIEMSTMITFSGYVRRKGLSQTRIAWTGLAIVMSLACAGVTGGPASGVRSTVPQNADAAEPADALPIAPPGEAAHDLVFTWGAVNLALQPPYDTVQLRALLRSATGAVV